MTTIVETTPELAGAPAPGRQAGPGGFVSDTLLIFRRQLRLSLRNPAWVIIGLIQPVLYLAFFGPLLAKVASGGLLGVPATTRTGSLFLACSSSSGCSARPSSGSRSSRTGGPG